MLDVIGDHIVLKYSRIGLVMALYVAVMVSFCFLHGVEVSVFKIFIVLDAFAVMFLTCSAYVNLGSNVNPRTSGCFTVGIKVLLMLKCSCVLYSAGSGVKSVEVDLSALRVRLFLIVQLCMSCK